VTSSRPALSRNGIRRRRQCDECGQRFSTIELIDTGRSAFIEMRDAMLRCFDAMPHPAAAPRSVSRPLRQIRAEDEVVRG
jgi:hypothetical protein